MTAPDPLRVAVVGSGPAGFYAASNLLSNGAEVDMFERLPTPWGLVRLGVAPDHPNIKAVSRVFEKVAQRPGFRFFGNVEIGTHLSADELRSHYHAVVWSVGAQADRRMGIPGEDLPGSLAATAFVAWYNGHPDYADLDVDLDVDRIVVVGNGNVAVDCARMLALTREELAPTDTTDDAIEAIVASRVSEIVILGRRGPARGRVHDARAARAGRARRRRRDGRPAGGRGEDSRGRDHRPAAQRRDRAGVRAARRAPTSRGVVRLRYLASPVELRGDGRVQEMVDLAQPPRAGPDGRCGPCRRARPRCWSAASCCARSATAARRSRACRSIRTARVIPNEGGRVAPGEYCSGWIKRGPSGIIGTNKKDANETAALILADAAAGLLPTPADPSPETIEALVPSVSRISSSTRAGRPSTRTSAIAASRTAVRA